jgi:hypothetical protein
LIKNNWDGVVLYLAALITFVSLDNSISTIDVEMILIFLIFSVRLLKLVITSSPILNDVPGVIDNLIIVLGKVDGSNKIPLVKDSFPVNVSIEPPETYIKLRLSP